MIARAYYNEFDPFAAQWLRNLIAAGLIAPGVVDERSISDVKASDLKGFTQCHFFAGIGGWSLALRLAGVADSFPCWTGSPPCQPFSTAGKQLGQLDERHLAPTFMRLVSECRPSIIFGEQVAAAIRKHWLDDLFDELEREKYACGAAVLPAASIGAPHKRDRLFFGAQSLDHSIGIRRIEGREGNNRGDDGRQFIAAGENGCLAKSCGTERNSKRVSGLGEGNQTQGGGTSTKFTGCGDISCLGYPNGERLEREFNKSNKKRWKEQNIRQAGLLHRTGDEEPSSSYQSIWSGADWLGCRDGKFRAVDAGTFPLANGIPARVGRLRGYGNAIVPQVAAEFIGAFLDSCRKAS